MLGEQTKSITPSTTATAGLERNATQIPLNPRAPMTQRDTCKTLRVGRVLSSHVVTSPNPSHSTSLGEHPTRSQQQPPLGERCARAGKGKGKGKPRTNHCCCRTHPSQHQDPTRLDSMA